MSRHNSYKMRSHPPRFPGRQKNTCPEFSCFLREAQNASTTPGRLFEIHEASLYLSQAQEETLGKALAYNPNTPKTLFAVLSEQHEVACASSPMMGLYILEDTKWCIENINPLALEYVSKELALEAKNFRFRLEFGPPESETP